MNDQTDPERRFALPGEYPHHLDWGDPVPPGLLRLEISIDVDFPAESVENAIRAFEEQFGPIGDVDHKLIRQVVALLPHGFGRKFFFLLHEKPIGQQERT